nr:MAG TPA: hypothetical protein [Caudoviricetes sp.]
MRHLHGCKVCRNLLSWDHEGIVNGEGGKETR